MDDCSTDTEWTTCQWTCESAYRQDRCGRGAAVNRWGLSLCWQHEDAAFRHVEMGIREGRYYRLHIEQLAEAMLHVGGLTTPDPLGGSPVDRLVRAEINRYLDRVIERGHSPTFEFGDKLDTIIGQRMQERWGS